MAYHLTLETDELEFLVRASNSRKLLPENLARLRDQLTKALSEKNPVRYAELVKAGDILPAKPRRRAGRGCLPEEAAAA